MNHPSRFRVWSDLFHCVFCSLFDIPWGLLLGRRVVVSRSHRAILVRHAIITVPFLLLGSFLSLLLCWLPGVGIVVHLVTLGTLLFYAKVLLEPPRWIRSELSTEDLSLECREWFMDLKFYLVEGAGWRCFLAVLKSENCHLVFSRMGDGLVVAERSMTTGKIEKQTFVPLTPP